MVSGVNIGNMSFIFKKHTKLVQQWKRSFDISTSWHRHISMPALDHSTFA